MRNEPKKAQRFGNDVLLSSFGNILFMPVLDTVLITIAFVVKFEIEKCVCRLTSFFFFKIVWLFEIFFNSILILI